MRTIVGLVGVLAMYLLATSLVLAESPQPKPTSAAETTPAPRLDAPMATYPWPARTEQQLRLDLLLPQERKQWYFDNGRPMYLTPKEYEQYQQHKKVRDKAFGELHARQQARAKEASNRLTGYAIGLAIFGLITACRCKSGLGAVLCLAVFLTAAAALFVVGQERSRPATPVHYSPPTFSS